MKKTVALIVIVFVGFYGVAQAADPATGKYSSKKVLYVDSYHKGYTWSDGITNGIKSIFKGTGVQLKVFRMDTKRNTSEEFKTKAALKAKALIEQFKPDLVIAADDNASKYLVMPYYKDSDLPFVFCGVNWDASVYGYPYKNATGMVEVGPIEEMLRYFKRFAKGDRIAYVVGENITSRIIFKNLNNRFFNGQMQPYLVKDFAEFKEVVLRVHDSVDAFLFNNNVGIKNWNKKEAIRFIEENVRIPSSTTTSWMTDYTLFGVAKLPEEQGAWAAETALLIFDGKPINEIPLSYNKMAVLTVNMRIAKKLGVVFDLVDLQKARIIR